MSDYCEVCESVAVATSSCPATDVIMVRGEVANATSSMVAAPQPLEPAVAPAPAPVAATPKPAAPKPVAPKPAPKPANTLDSLLD